MPKPLIATVLLLLTLPACVVVPAYARESFADPNMTGEDDITEAQSQRKLHTSREAASGADGRPSGGGCGCTN